ncbi:tetratricopeptide repeat protein [Tenacibaculum amylolyticum]|uniref:tetratricopeptide repeat protein n=1 Tax=Tenacibaculum amylolyticum TaxID=104269 RepID=UPI0038942BE2
MKYLLTILMLCITTVSFSQTKIDTLQQKFKHSTSEEEQLKILDRLTKEMIRSNHPKQKIYLEKLISLAKKQGDYDLAASKTRFIAQQHIYGGKPDSAIYVVEEMLKEKPKFKKTKSEAHLLLKRGGAYFNKELLDVAAKDYDEAADLFLISGDSIFAADARYFAGQVYTNLKDFLKALDRYENAYKLYSILGDKQYANLAQTELGGLYEINRFYDKAILEKKKSLREALVIKNYAGVATVYLHLAGNYFHKKELKKSKKYIDSAVSFIDSITSNVKQERTKTYVEIYSLRYYLEKNDLKNAEKHLIAAEKQKEKTDAPEYYNTFIQYYKALYYKKIGKYNEAEKALNKILSKKGRISNIGTYVKAEKLVAEIYALKNNYKKAYEHAVQYLKAKDSLDREINTNTFLYYQTQFETERKDNEIFKKEAAIALLEKDNEIEKNKKDTLWIIIIFILILSSVISYAIWKQGKLKRKELAKKIADNKKELNAYTKLLIEKSKTQQSLTEEIENLKEEIGAQQSAEKLQDLTAIKILTNEDWYAFKEKFKRVYPNFFASIKNKGFELTKAEERLIAMEKLYLDTKEIASMLAISQDSVTRSRSRLRKKINAPKGSSLLDYLEAS